MAEGKRSVMVQADLDNEQLWIIEEEVTEEKKSPRCENCMKNGPPRGEDLFEFERWLEQKNWLEPRSWLEPELRFEQECWLVERVAVFFCSKCELYVCVNCLPGHESHEGIRVGRKESEREKKRDIRENEKMEEQSSSERTKNEGKGLGERMRLEEGGEEKGEKSEIDRMEEWKEREANESARMEEETEIKLTFMLDDLIKESETERKEEFDRRRVSIYDRVYVRRELDQELSLITGLCGLENQRWVVCDYDNRCIKIYTLGSNVLQRYIRIAWFLRLLSKPWDVTEILVNQNSTEPNLVSGSSSSVSVTDRAEQNKQCLIAVTLPDKRQIIFIDLSKIPAFTHKIIPTEGQCHFIQFYDNKIFTACKKDYIDYSWSVYIYSTDGDKLNKFNTGIYDAIRGPYLAVASGRVYLTDKNNNTVQCRNVEGHFLSEITIEGSVPAGISVDPDNNVFVCAHKQDKVYKLDADLTRYESVLDQTAGYLEGPEVLCYYRNKLFISHLGSPSLENFVTVVRLL